MSLLGIIEKDRMNRILRELFNKLEGDDVILPNFIGIDDNIISLQYINLISINFNTHYKECYLDCNYFAASNNDITDKESKYMFKVMMFFDKYEDKIIEILSEVSL